MSFCRRSSSAAILSFSSASWRACCGVPPPGRASLVAAARIAAHGLLQAFREIALLLRELIGTLGKIVELRAGLLLAHPVHHALGFGETFRRAPRVGLRARALRILLGALLRLPHVVESLLQAIDRLLHLLLIPR